MTNSSGLNVNRLPDPAKRNYFMTKPEVFDGNNSGIEPCGTKILVLTDSIGDMTNTGKLHLPPDVVERMTLAITTGVVVAVGGAALTDWPNSDRKWPGRCPSIGDRVHIAKYAGIIVEGKDGKRYRLIQDTDLCGFEVGDHKPQSFVKGDVQ